MITVGAMKGFTDNELTDAEKYEAAAIAAEMDADELEADEVVPDRGWRQVLSAMQEGELDLLEAATMAVELGLSEDEHEALDHLQALES